jgi:MinD-like ATPase involved in chromosome partitioning or flagellar assembly
MLDARTHQAVGLMNLRAPAIQVVPMLSAHAGVGRRTLMRHLALAELRRARRPLLIDEESGQLARRVEVHPTGDLQDCLDGHAPLESLWQITRDGLPVLAGERGLAALAMRPQALARWLATLPQQPAAPSLMLIHARSGQGGVVQALAELGVPAVLVTTTEADAITATYQLAKRLSAHALMSLGVLYNLATVEQAMRAHEGLADAAQRFLGLRLDYLGSAPYDPLLAGLPPGVRRRPVPLSAAGSVRPACDRLLNQLQRNPAVAPLAGDVRLTTADPLQSLIS